MAIRLDDDEREVYNYAIQYHVGVEELRGMLRDQGYFRKPYAIVVTLRELRMEYGMISQERYELEVQRDVEKAAEFHRRYAAHN